MSSSKRSPPRSPKGESCMGIRVSAKTYEASVTLEDVMGNESEAVQGYADGSKIDTSDPKKPKLTDSRLNDYQYFFALVLSLAGKLADGTIPKKKKVIIENLEDKLGAKKFDLVRKIPMFFGGAYLGVNQISFKSTGYVYSDVIRYLEGDDTIVGQEELFSKALINSINYFIGKAYASRYSVNPVRVEKLKTIGL